MGKIYVNQTALKIRLNTGIDLTAGVSNVYINYKKPAPDSSTGQWAGAVEETYYISKVFSAGEIDVAGEWKFWATVEFSDTTAAPGEPENVVVFNEGN